MQIEKTVFISYRRTNSIWAMMLYKELTHHGFDVFFDYTGLSSGDFEQAIIENIQSRAHFLLVLTPSALERCNEPGDWLRREIETAMDYQRNIVPLMLEGFYFGAPTVAPQLTGKLDALKGYNGLGISVEYLDAAMTKLREKFLNVALDAVLHPASERVRQSVTAQKTAADAAPEVLETELTAQSWFERGVAAINPDEKFRFYCEAIRLDPDFAMAYKNRGNSQHDKGNVDDAIADFTEAIRLDPEYVSAYFNRGHSCNQVGKHSDAVADFQKYLELGGGRRDGDQDEVEKIIHDLKKKF